MKITKTHIFRESYKSHPKAQFLLLGGILFSLGMVTSVATTYAWFQINPLWSIPDLNVRIISRADDYWLHLALENKDGVIDPYNDEWKKNNPERYDEDGYFTGFTLDEMDYDGKGLHDVSGMFASEWMNNPEKTRPEFRRNYGPFPGSPDHYTKSTVAEDGYIQVVLWFTAGEKCEVYLTPDSGVLSADTEETAKEKNKNLSDLQLVTNTVRFSFYSEDGYYIAKEPEDAVHEYLTYDTYYGGILDMNGDGYYDYDGNGKEVLYGEYSGEVTYNDGKSDEHEGKKDGSTFDAYHKPNVKQVNVDYEKIVKEPAESIKAFIFEEDKPLRPLIPICKLEKDEKKSVVFSIYCEGWDKYMTDALESAAFNINLGFTALIKG